MTRFRLRDDFGHHRQVLFVLGIKRQCNQLERRRFGLAEKSEAFRKAEITPGFAQS